jgi:hypothetical protein
MTKLFVAKAHPANAVNETMLRGAAKRIGWRLVSLYEEGGQWCAYAASPDNSGRENDSIAVFDHDKKVAMRRLLGALEAR